MMRYSLRTVLLLLMLALLFSSRSALAEESDFESVRSTMMGFLKDCNKKTDEGLDEAAQHLVFSDPATTDEHKRLAAKRLKAIIDRMAWVDKASLSDKPDGDPYLFPPKADVQPIEISRKDGDWKFSAETVKNIDSLYKEYKDKPVVKALKGGTPWYRKYELFGNSPSRFMYIFLALLLGWIIGRIIKATLTRSANALADRERFFVAAISRAVGRSAVPMLLTVGLSVGLEFLALPSVVKGICDTVVSVLYAVAVAYVFFCLVDVIEERLHVFSQKTKSKLDDMLAPMVCTTARSAVVVLGLVQIATILSDKPMTSIIAGLGVGGLAIGLAAQDMIKNFFGSLMIFTDRPFEMGDRVEINGIDGIVERVGFRSTRIRTLIGHLVTMPNGDVANSSITSIAARPFIKRSFGVTVTYDTSPDKVQQATDILKDILADHEGMDAERPPRVHFDDMTDIALNIGVSYWYSPPDYWAYCEMSERVNFEILRRFNDEGIEFAFPTQTLYLAGDPNRPLKTDAA